MKNITETKVSKIVAQNFKTAQVFTEYGIDFCCNGGIPLREACQNQNVELNTIVEQINQALIQPQSDDFSSMPLDNLVRYIQENHHSYVRSTIPALKSYLSKLCRVHGERHPELFHVKELFSQSSQELMLHMKKEEQILFPYIIALVESQKHEFELSKPHFGHLENPIALMRNEHDTEGSRFKEIALITNGYVPPKDACQTYRVAYLILNEFETDLHKHIHLENNILFPKAIEMYQSVFES